MHVADQPQLLERLEVPVDDGEIGAREPPVQAVGELLGGDQAVGANRASSSCRRAPERRWPPSRSSETASSTESKIRRGLSVARAVTVGAARGCARPRFAVAPGAVRAIRNLVAGKTRKLRPYLLRTDSSPASESPGTTTGSRREASDGPVDRRGFLKSAGVAAGTAAVMGAPGLARAATEEGAEVVDASRRRREAAGRRLRARRGARRGHRDARRPRRRPTATAGSSGGCSRRRGCPPSGREGVMLDVVASRSTRDQQGPGRRQHRRLRVRQPGQARHGHDHHQLHPARGPGGRPELLRVRRRRPVLDLHRQRRRRAARHHVPVQVRERAAQPEHVPLQHRARSARSTTRTGTGVSSTTSRRSSGEAIRPQSSHRRPPCRRRRATSARARRRTTRRSRRRRCTRCRPARRCSPASGTTASSSTSARSSTSATCGRSRTCT